MIMQETEDMTHITGAVQQYYASQAAADKGHCPVWVDEVYARRSRLTGLWDVNRITVQPLLPPGTRLPAKISLLVSALVPFMPVDDVVTIAKGVDMRTAFDMVRQHETDPLPLGLDEQAESDLVRVTVRKPEDSLTHWGQLQI